MTRLPVPGNDEGSWGDVLNSYLLQAHTSDGTLKPDSVGPAQLQDNAVTSSNVADDSIAQTKIQNLTSDLGATEKTANKGVANGYAPLDGTGKVPSANMPPTGSVPDATTTSKGVVQLAGDLGGTATAPTVPGLAATEKTVNKGAANGYAPLDGSGKVPSTNLPTPATVPDATTTSKGIVQLAGDLSGTAATPTVPGLAAKANDSSVVHLSGTETISGDKNFTGALTHTSNAVVDTTDSRLTDARTPLAHKATHATGGSDALTPSDINAVDKAGSNIATMANSTLQFLRVNVPDDGSGAGTWPDRMAFYFASTRTGYHNEYGELRARPAKQNTIALRAMGHTLGSTGNIFEVASTDASTLYLSVSQTQVTTTVPVITPNLPQKITVSSTAPTSPQDGDVWFDTSGA